MDAEELEASLQSHALRAARRACAKLGGPLDETNLARFLQDTDCLRYRTELRFDDAGLDPHQFAEPAFEAVEGERRCILHVRSRFRVRVESHPYIVAYMAAAINYGPAASGPLCELHGAALMNLSIQDFYDAVCAMADA